MNKWLVLLSVFAIAACSSAPKEETTESPAPVEQPAAPAQEDTKESMAMDKGGVTPTADSAMSMDGGFPDVEGTERSGATCKNGSDERLVSVIDTREGPCGVVYTKNGDKKTVAYAKHDMSFCDNVYDNIIGNLTGGGFDCGGASSQSQSEGESSAEDSTSENK